MKNISKRRKTYDRINVIVGIILTFFVINFNFPVIGEVIVDVSQSYFIDGYAEYSNGTYADGAKVDVISSVGTVYTYVGHADGWSSGYWQVNVGSLGGPGWPRNTSFTVEITFGDWFGSIAGMVSNDLNVYYTHMGTILLYSEMNNMVNAGATMTTIVTGESVAFNGSVIEGIPPYNWFWDFDDGNTSIEQNPTHRYTIAGSYEIHLTVTNDYGVIDNDTITVNVYDGELIDVLGNYFIDMDDDGVYDSLWNESSRTVNTMDEIDDGIYLIDDNGDGNWDYKYNENNGEKSYDIQEEIFNSDEKTPGFEFFFIILAIIVIYLFIQTRRI